MLGEAWSHPRNHHDDEEADMSDQTTPAGEDTPLDELNDQGVGLGAGDANTFEPEEAPDTE